MDLRFQRFEYFTRSAKNFFLRRHWQCPSCDHDAGEIVERKMLVTALVRCRRCELLYRVPTDTVVHSTDFYQDAYESGLTTQLPTDQRLKEMVDRGFAGTEKDFSWHIDMMKRLGMNESSRILDYGASWGYATWQMRRAGLKSFGFEVSRGRARFAREKLNVDVVDQQDQIQGPFDLIFASHVIEHVPRLSDFFSFARGLIAPGGLFVFYTPNGSTPFRERDPQHFHHFWGNNHPNFLDDRFYRRSFPDRPMLLASDPYDVEALAGWNRKESKTFDLSGEELLAIIAW